MSKSFPWKKVMYGGLLVLLFGIIAGVGWYHSEYATIDRLIQSVQKKDTKSFLSIVPTFKDGDKISKKQATVFLGSLNKKKASEIEQLFYEKGQDAFFSAKKFLPEKRYLNVEVDGEEALSFQLYKKTFTINEDRVGPFIPGEYTFEMHMQSDVFGLSKKTIQENLTQENQTLEFDEEEAHLDDDSFYSLLLENLVNFYSSMNQGISNNLNFSSLQFTSEETAHQIQLEFDELRDYLSSYKQSFSKAIMNADSLKLEQFSTYEATFDCFIDLHTEIKFVEEVGIDESILDTSENAVVQMIYDEQTKQWVVDSIDFETLSQDPTEWENKKALSLKTENVGAWNKNSSGSSI